MYYQNRNTPLYYNPINVPSRRSYINPLSGKKTFNMSRMIQSTEKGIDTISSLIPLYNKIKPVINQGKTMLSSVNNFFQNKTVKQRKVEHVEAEVVDSIKPSSINKEETKSEEYNSYRTNNTESKPFFL